MSEMELSILRQRSMEASKQKPNRGELLTTVAIGFVKARHDRIEMEPDLRGLSGMKSQHIYVLY